MDLKMERIFLCGAARRDITPEIGACLFGYKPNHASTSIHDNLNVVAVAFSDGTSTAVLLTATVCEIRTDIATDIREKVGKALGIDGRNIILSATHTHSAPNCVGMEGWGDVDWPYVNDIFTPACLEAAKEACAALAPAEVGIGTTESKVGINRRQILRSGWIALGQNPFGCFDPEMTVVAVREKISKKGIVNIVHYGCHGTAAGCNREISRDWSGIMCDRLEADSGTLTSFWNGCEGDVGPRLTNGKTVGDIHYVEELGGTAAADARRAMDAIRVWKDGDLKLFKGTIKLPFKPRPALEDVRKNLAAYAGREDSIYNLERLIYAHWRDTENALLSGDQAPEAFTFDQTIVSIGDVAFVPFPFEVFAEITLRLRAYSPFAHTLSLSCTNGANAYLPCQSELVRGGYEVACFLYNGVNILADNTDQNIICENLRLIEES